ncbi:MAG: hypothetical protein IPG42_13155 [Betaproteobacteria bacterium]|nr:hypothetical protein [Betaproteobacteria bacterium]
MLQLPRPVLLTRLTYAALVPFGVLTLLLWIVNAQAHPFVATGMLMYGAVIASFWEVSSGAWPSVPTTKIATKTWWQALHCHCSPGFAP